MQKPLSHWGIHGHTSVLSYFERVLARSALAHAYLFSGTQSIGKKTIALQLGRALLCTEDTRAPRPCGACAACRSLAHGAHPDLQVIERREDATEISVEQMRELGSALQHTALFEGYRVAIIDDADTMTHGAANSLLKMLEEPRGKTIIIMIASAAHRVLPTIRSRVVTLHLSPMTDDAVERLLERIAPKGTDISTVVLCAQGCMGTALRMIREPEFFAAREEDMERAHELFRARTWTERRRLIEGDTETWSAAAMIGTLRTMAAAEFRRTLADPAAARAWAASLESIVRTETILRETNVQPLFALEQMLFSLPAGAASSTRAPSNIEH